MAIFKIILLPFSLLYGILTSIRNGLFHAGILKSRHFPIPVLCVGNITVGGTGKTPHTEWLISKLKEDFRVACLSRGYKRQTSGFILADARSTAREIGDEPMQIKSKYPDIVVACDTNRVRGIQKLLALQTPPEAIILDDAFQHRYVQAGKNIVLVDYSRPVYEDCLLPAGRLRESPGALKRADYIIVTKCPSNLQPIERRILAKHLKIKPYQRLFFTTFKYGPACPLFPEAEPLIPTASAAILCVTGIARPAPYAEHLKTLTPDVSELRYPDHRHFTKKDIQQIENRFRQIKNKEKYIFTTEKDAVRLKTCELSQELKQRIYYIPIVPAFLENEELFLNEISGYVRKNKR